MAIDHRYTQVMFEQILSNNQAIFEVLAPTVKDVAHLKEKVDKALEEIRLHRAILKAHENDIEDHDQRIITLEAAA